jgi:hypothetical protein
MERQSNSLVDALGGQIISSVRAFHLVSPQGETIHPRFTENPCAAAVVAGVSEFQERFIATALQENAMSRRETAVP